jgi:hypothetical protein
MDTTYHNGIPYTMWPCPRCRHTTHVPSKTFSTFKRCRCGFERRTAPSPVPPMRVGHYSPTIVQYLADSEKRRIDQERSERWKRDQQAQQAPRPIPSGGRKAPKWVRERRAMRERDEKERKWRDERNQRRAMKKGRF